ncbi:NAD(P)/FAD-dependent oxidoreductase [Sphaerisporangium siamense]|uniref:D-amino-acid dehydrogenase n=1 Tax=Sphaerisporangium siamense TaxID=795645 RepID=A0A7W7DCP9_9ACTN|nr:FAD-dependent oxidoreductase [Sphaerisporangium siamense]MBB4704119.1 D-amino-acid dehydrogenase [Sphaerisporangium siamense]
MSIRVVVLGNGIVGASTAYHLAVRGASVTVIDRPRLGRATDAGAGIVCPWVDHDGDDAWYRLALEGSRYYTTLAGLLAEDGETDISHARVGALLVAEDPAELATTEALLRGRAAAAPDMGRVGAVDRPAGLFPPLAPSLTALFVPGAARVDGRVVRDALERAAVRRGARVRGGAAALTPAGAPLLDGTALDADAVVVAAGAWAGEVCAPIGLPVAVGPRRGQIVHAELPGLRTEGWPIVLPRRGPYLLGFPGSRVVLGATVEDAGFDPRATVGGVAEVLSGGARLAPGLKEATIVETRSGLRPVTGDGRPLLGALGGHAANVVVATGLGAYGLTAGPYMGMIAACLALGERPPLDVTPFSADPAERERDTLLEAG